MEEREIDGQTELEFLEWLYKVIGDDEVDYMWSLSGRIGELRAIKSKNDIYDIINGCGERFAIEGSEHCFPTIGSVCGDNRMHQEGDEPNLCKKCYKKYLDAIEEHRKSWNPNFKITYK